MEWKTISRSGLCFLLCHGKAFSLNYIYVLVHTYVPTTLGTIGGLGAFVLIIVFVEVLRWYLHYWLLVCFGAS